MLHLRPVIVRLRVLIKRRLPLLLRAAVLRELLDVVACLLDAPDGFLHERAVLRVRAIDIHRTENGRKRSRAAQSLGIGTENCGSPLLRRRCLCAATALDRSAVRAKDNAAGVFTGADAATGDTLAVHDDGCGIDHHFPGRRWTRPVNGATTLTHARKPLDGIHGFPCEADNLVEPCGQSTASEDRANAVKLDEFILELSQNISRQSADITDIEAVRNVPLEFRDIIPHALHERPKPLTRGALHKLKLQGFPHRR